MTRDEGQKFVRLKPSFIAKFATHPRCWPMLKQFTLFYRKVKDYHGQVERHYPRLIEGLSVPVLIAKAFFEYLGEKKGENRFIMEQEIESAEPLMDENDGGWFNWGSIAEIGRRPFKDRDEMYVSDPGKEIPVIADSFLKYIGQLDRPPMSDDEKLRRGEQIRGMSVGDYAAWLQSIQSREYRSIMYAVMEKNDECKTVAVSVMLPTSESVFREITEGRLRPEEISLDDVPCFGKYVWIEALAPIGQGINLSVSTRSRSEVHCMMYQVAYFTRELSPFRPVFYMVAPSRLYRKRLDRQGYREAGSYMKGTKEPIIVLRHGREIVKGWHLIPEIVAPYELMRATLRPYRWANSALWRDEDKSRK